MSGSLLRSPAFVVCATLLLGSAAGLGAAVSALRIVVRKRPIVAEYKCPSVPSETPSWRQEGADERVSKDVQDALGTDNHVSRLYVRRDGRPVLLRLHLAYYTGTIDTVPHVPDRCWSAAGMKQLGLPHVERVALDRSRWLVDEAATAEARAALGEAGATVRTAPVLASSTKGRPAGARVRLPRGIEDLEMRFTAFQPAEGGRTVHAAYFFIANGGLTPEAPGVRKLAFDLRSEYAYYMKVEMSTASVESAEEMRALAGEFLSEMLPDVCECVPDWTLVLRGEYPDDNPRRGRPGAGGGAGGAGTGRGGGSGVGRVG